MSLSSPPPRDLPWFHVGTSDVRLLRDGTQAYPAMLEAIRNAETEVLLEFYWITPDIVGKLNSEVVRVLHTSEMRERLAALGAEPIGNSPEAFAAFIKAEIPKWAKVVKDAGIKVE